MERVELKNQLEKLDLMFEKFYMTPQLFNSWADKCKGLNGKTFARAVEEVIKHEEYAPSLATVLRYYREIETENKTILSKAKESYLQAITALGIPKNTEEYKAYLSMINAAPREERMELAEKISMKVVNYANKATSEGLKPKSFIALIKECSA